MLQYRRRNQTTPAPERSMTPVHALVGLCNWSYDRDRRIDTQTLKNILGTFSPEHIYLYLRIFNEGSPRLLSSFIQYEHLDPSRVDAIYRLLRDQGYDLRELNEFR
jgi:hypothetical protein